MLLSQPKRVAIIGGGCTGVTAFWALRNSLHDVHLFEASPTLGGRIKTLPFENEGNQVDVNTESSSFNATASPNFVSLLCHLGLSTSVAPLRFGVSDGVSTFQWCSSVLEDILLRPWILGHLETWRILFEIIRLKYLAVDVLHVRAGFGKIHAQHGSSADGYFSKEGYSKSFYAKYLIPLLSTIWGTDTSRFLDIFPINALIHSLYDQQIFCTQQAVPKWRRIDIGASQFIQTMTRNFPPTLVHLKTRVRKVFQSAKRPLVLSTSDGQEMYFDHVIFALPGNQILQVLDSNIYPEEKEIIQGFGTARNIAVLHSDPLLLLDTDQLSSSCSHIISSDHYHKNSPNSSFQKSCLTYNVNVLQDIPTCLFGHIFITLNPFKPPHPSLVQGVWEFTDPEISPSTLRAQSRLPSIQNQRGLSYCFSWTGRGTFEDAVTAGLRVAIEDLGAQVPFEVDIHPNPLDSEELPTFNLGLKKNLIRTILSLIHVYLLIFEILIILLGFWKFRD